MAVGNFVGFDGHRYMVEFSGSGVPDDTLTIVGVTIGMGAQDRKFVGFKSTSCRVSVLADAPLVWAYANGAKAIAVEVYDETDSEVVFTGYVVPFVFEQTYTGMADAVTIDCVDAVTAAKDKLYRSAEDYDKYGIDVPAWSVVYDVVSHAGGHSKVREIIYHKNFDWANAEGKTLDAMVAQAGFLQDEMTALDAMNAVCMFFGYTACMVGNKLVFYDEHCLTHAADGYARNAVVERWSYDGGWKKSVTKYWQSASSPFRKVAATDVHNDISVSVERAYDGVQLTPSGRAVSVLLPDVCADENIRANTDGRGTDPLMTGSTYHREYRQPIESKVMELGTWDSPRDVDEASWRNGAMMLAVRGFEQDPSVFATWKGGESSAENILWLRAYDAQSMLYGTQILRYSHTRGLVELRLKCRFVKTDLEDMSNEYTPKEMMDIRLLQIKVGDKYLADPYGRPIVYDTNPVNDMYIDEDGSLLATSTAQGNWSGAYQLLCTDNSQIGVELRFHAVSGKTPIQGELKGEPVGLIITQLEMVGVGDEVWTGFSDMRHEYVEGARDMLEVSVGLTTRDSYQEFNPDNHGYVYGINARPGVVTAIKYPCGGYMGEKASENCTMGGIIMRQLKERYGEPHLRYSMTVDGVVRPTDTVTFNGGTYTVEGYERDLVNNTTKITIN